MPLFELEHKKMKNLQPAFYKAAVDKEGRIVPSLFQKTAQHLEENILGEIKKCLAKTKDVEMEKDYQEARKLFLKFLQKKHFSLATELMAKYAPH